MINDGNQLVYTASMRKLAILPLLLFLVSCSKQGTSTAPATDLPRATVVLRDGTSVTGAVASSTPTDITLNLDDGGSRTIPMKQVRSVDYGDTASTAPSAPPASAPPADSAPPAASAPPAGPRRGANPEPSAPPPGPATAYTDQPTAAQITSVTHVLEVGTEIPVRTEETIDSGKAAEGQVFAADIARDIRDASGAVVIPRGSNAQIVIKSASKGGKIRGASDLVLDMKSVSIGGQLYRLDTASIAQKGREGVGVNKRTGEFAGGGAAIGAIIGAIAGGGKGAAIGAGAGAGAGALGQVLTRGTIKVPAETVLTFKLDGPLKVVQAQ